ncbi:MAG: cob(I)yrinic acid a,c-diamide adenosyltransferase [Pseudopedobacter saltans]|uniref:Corrinoid adenosyltransferase n=1 Tax=Pseudopedobacter saltans TaxID=151895 RepID=A0A2W5FBA5_9SPHI|nr:MAG: cob(I)yrinic acid a,c-diamide adenosyltransferase [Pseudopedobacter saltans]
MAFKIYTKTGDKGTTRLIGGSRVSKSDGHIEACGTLDELNSHIGLVADLLGSSDDVLFLREIQKDLFVLGAIVTLDVTKKNAPEIPLLKNEKIQQLEEKIDHMEALLPTMTHFILPGGHPTVSQIHIARSVCRRAERVTTYLKVESYPTLPENVLQYINRLSDFLFVFARHIGQQLGVEEIKWIPEKD